MNHPKGGCITGIEIVMRNAWCADYLDDRPSIRDVLDTAGLNRTQSGTLEEHIARFLIERKKFRSSFANLAESLEQYKAQEEYASAVQRYLHQDQCQKSLAYWYILSVPIAAAGIATENIFITAVAAGIAYTAYHARKSLRKIHHLATNDPDVIAYQQCADLSRLRKLAFGPQEADELHACMTRYLTEIGHLLHLIENHHAGKSKLHHELLLERENVSTFRREYHSLRRIMYRNHTAAQKTHALLMHEQSCQRALSKTRDRASEIIETYSSALQEELTAIKYGPRKSNTTDERDAA